MYSKPFNKKIIHGVCTDLSFEGKGVLKDKDGVIFVNGMFPGEEGDVEVLYSRAGVSFAKLKKLNKKSDDRIEPRCPVSFSCGGCCFQSLAYPAQLLYKSKKVKEQFRKIGGLDVEVRPTLGMDDPYNYRNKIQMPFSLDNKGNVVSGFFKEGTHKVIPVESCSIEDKRSEKILASIRHLCASMRIFPYDEDTGRGILRHVLIKTSFHHEEIMVVIVTAVDSFPSRNNFVKQLLKENPEISTIVQNINQRKTNVILGDVTKNLYGKGYIRDSLLGVEFSISAKSFYQTNPIMTEVLYTEAIKAAMITKDDVVFDAYSGIGTIGLIAASKAKEVISVEIVKEAVRDAQSNAKRNGITNFTSILGDAGEVARAMARDKKNISVLFMDPPRKGSDENFLNAVKTLKPSRIVYVSCDPSTLARDCKYLSDQYVINSVQPVDLFPQTYHVETVALLVLKDSKK